MAIRWSETTRSARIVIREILQAQRRAALSTAIDGMQAHKLVCTRCSDIDHDEIALKMSKELEDALDAAVEHLGLAGR